MKKLLMLSAVVFAVSVSPALAEEGGEGHDGKKRHHKAKMFERNDTDGNGTVSKSEFMAAHEKKFKEIDTDGDGEITKDEIKARRAAWKEKHEEHRSSGDE